MALITEIIPKQNFEIIHDKIGEILTVELANQKVLQTLPENAEVFKERIIAIDKTEEIVIAVLLDGLNSSSVTQSDQENKTNYFVDVYASGKAEGTTPGDNVVASKLQKYLGMVRYILQSHKYVTLDLPAGTIGNKNVDRVQMHDQENTQDANYSRMGRISFSVRIMENQKLWDGVLLDNNTTKVKLELTDKGYQYKLKP